MSTTALPPADWDEDGVLCWAESGPELTVTLDATSAVHAPTITVAGWSVTASSARRLARVLAAVAESAEADQGSVAPLPRLTETSGHGGELVEVCGHPSCWCATAGSVPVRAVDHDITVLLDAETDEWLWECATCGSCRGGFPRREAAETDADQHPQLCDHRN